MKGAEKLVYGLLILVLLMVNPPILGLVNAYAKTTPFTLGYPTLWMWLQLWYLIGIVVFLIGAIRLKSWQKEYPEVNKK